jgi:hypothetical protein
MFFPLSSEYVVAKEQEHTISTEHTFAHSNTASIRLYIDICINS